jgi:hypothetical protein
MLGWVQLASARSSNAARSLWWLGTSVARSYVMTGKQILHDGVTGGEDPH